MSDRYVVGEVARLPITISDNAGMPLDPGSVVLKLKLPIGTVSTYTYNGGPEVVRDAAGQYHADITLSTAGLWAYRWELGAPHAGAAEGVIPVEKSRVI